MNRSIIIIIGIILASFQGCNSQTEKAAVSGSDTSVTKSAEGFEEAGDISGAAPVHITKAEFLTHVMNYEMNTEEWVYEGELPCIVDFYADWCAPCRISSPVLDELAVEYAGKLIIYKVDIDEEQELAAVFGIQSIPAFLFCPMEGNPTMSSGIAQTLEDTKMMFRQHIEEILFNSSLSDL